MTPLDKQQIQRIVDEHPIAKEFVDSGDAATTAKLLSMGYVLITIGNAYLEDAVDLLDKHKLLKGKLKTKTVNFTASFDTLDKELFKFITNDESKRKFCEDVEQFSKICDVVKDKGLSVISTKQSDNNCVKTNIKTNIKHNVKKLNIQIK